jgi:NADH-quinone oxidoreductase subunit L
MYIQPMLFGDFFGNAIKVLPARDTLAQIHFEGIGPFIAHGMQSLPFLLAVAGIFVAWLFYIRAPHLPGLIQQKAHFIYAILVRKYGFDDFNDFVFAGGARGIGRVLWRVVDVKLIDGLAVNGTARVVGWTAAVMRHVQSGYIYHYAFAMILGLLLLMTFFLHR